MVVSITTIPSFFNRKLCKNDNLQHIITEHAICFHILVYSVVVTNQECNSQLFSFSFRRSLFATLKLAPSTELASQRSKGWQESTNMRTVECIKRVEKLVSPLLLPCPIMTSPVWKLEVVGELF